MADHYRRPRNAGGLEDATFTKHSAETSCGDEGEFHVSVGSDGTIEELSFESESCAVSTAVASLLTEHLAGEPVETAATLDGTAVELLDGQFPDLRRECVTGPERVIREGAREHLDASAESAPADD
nr:iron-sulfur cluster assembly scaffold protein [Halorussus marinus]